MSLKKRLVSAVLGAALAASGAAIHAQDSAENQYVTVVFGQHSSDQMGSAFAFSFEGRKRYEDLVVNAARQLRPGGLLGRMACGDKDPIECGKARPTSAFYRPEFTVLHDGEPNDALPIVKKFFEVCNATLGQNMCTFSRPAAGYDDRALEHFPPGAKRAVLIGGKLYGAIIGASMTLCYNGPCASEDVIEEAFWSGVLPIMNAKELPLRREENAKLSQQ